MVEVWKDVKGYEGLYEVSNLGAVRSKDRHVDFVDKRGYKAKRFYPSRVVKQRTIKGGYLICELSRNGNRERILAHRLVAMNFLENENCLKEVNHIDADKTNNKVNNLEWVTRGENIRHAFRLGLVKREKGSKLYNSKFAEEDIVSIRKSYKEGTMNINDLARMYNVNRKTMDSICTYKSWKHVI